MSPITRRGLLAGAGAACAATCAAGCATYGTPRGAAPEAAPPPGGPPAPQPSGQAGAPQQGLAAASDIPVGGGTVFASDGVVVTQPVAGQYAAFGATCPHAGCLVDQVTGTGISCPCHGSIFALTDGAPIEGPAKAPLESRTVKVDGGRIVVA
ncbi:Rieske (2Fe-2S) protein [Pseudonocardia phyllosphaerae]|uniref:Rieske (2Fe-2S) protein n=1 Tax=Pseudonocardia phyllosphaerae TaxID=3390502 RepID=UPI003979D9A1